jgi:hypothetical protein
MAHYAKVVNGIVTHVIVADQEFVRKLEGDWVRTSYNMKFGVYYDPDTNEPADDQSVINGDEARMRKNFAGTDWNYDGVGFYPPQPYPSWTLNSSTYDWECPVPYPDDGKKYDWNEDNQSWDEVV